jgi:hypothetical protein
MTKENPSVTRPRPTIADVEACEKREGVLSLRSVKAAFAADEAHRETMLVIAGLSRDDLRKYATKRGLKSASSYTVGALRKMLGVGE